MQSIIWDTSLYIARLRNGFNWNNEQSENLILSSVAIAELATGYVNKTPQANEFKSYVEQMFSTNRVLNPSFYDWYNSGIIIGKIIKSRPDLKNKKALLFNDCLIATSSTQINAKVITANLKDFELIKSHLNFEVSYTTC